MQYVDAHWSSDAEKFVAPEATPAAKEAIRRMLPQGLKESISKVRTFKGTSRGMPSGQKIAARMDAF